MSDLSDLEILREAKNFAPVDVPALILRLGINYVRYPMPDYRSGYIERSLDGRFKIAVNSKEGKQRQRFTAAHELGHYFLHRDLLLPGGRHMDRLYGKVQNITGTGNFINETHERQANGFAAELLMPKGLVRSKFKEVGRDHLEVARFFQVSGSAMAWRIHNLGLADKRQLGLAT